MECRIEGALGHLEDVLGDLLDALRDGPAVLWLERERSEDQQIERALRQIDAFATHHPVSPFALLQEHSVTTPVEAQRVAPRSRFPNCWHVQAEGHRDTGTTTGTMFPTEAARSRWKLAQAPERAQSTQRLRSRHLPQL